MIEVFFVFITIFVYVIILVYYGLYIDYVTSDDLNDNSKKSFLVTMTWIFIIIIAIKLVYTFSLFFMSPRELMGPLVFSFLIELFSLLVLIAMLKLVELPKEEIKSRGSYTPILICVWVSFFLYVMAGIVVVFAIMSSA